MEKLKSLIAYFIKTRSKKTKKTELVKFVYWFEYLRVQTYGSQLTEARFIRHNYGPYAYEIEKAVSELAVIGAISLQRKIYPDYRKHLYGVGNINILNQVEELSSIDQMIAKQTIADLGGLRYRYLIKKVYDTPPMVKILNMEYETQEKKYGEVLDMFRSNPIYKPILEDLIKARERRLAREDRGSDIDYIKCIHEEFKETEPLRRRATKYGK